jgi:hypothetical protein
MVLETLIIFNQLSSLITQEDSINFRCHKNFKSYIINCTIKKHNGQEVIT